MQISNIQKETLQELLKQDLPDPLAEAIRLRLSTSRTPIKKYHTMLEKQFEGRFYQALAYHAARTGRWSSMGLNFQNLSRPKFKDTDNCIELFKHLDPDILEALYDDVTDALLSSLRGMIISSPGHRLIVDDFKAIEARVLAWLARESVVLQVFNTHERLYAHTAAGIYNKPIETISEDSPERFVGKVAALALGYQGAIGALAKMAEANGLDLAVALESVLKLSTHRQIDKVKWKYGKARERGTTFGLTKRQYVAAGLIVELWRAANPNIVQYWEEVELAAMAAVRNPGRAFFVGQNRLGRDYTREQRDELRATLVDVRFKVEGDFLRCRLPSGRKMSYYRPSIRPGTHGNDQVAYYGKVTGMRGFHLIHSYGGMFCIANDTPVLTKRGWIQIQNIHSTDILWDGEQWTPHGGLVNKGIKKVINAHGVLMTPEHKVFTEGGWVNASQSERYKRIQSRLPDGEGISWKQWEEIPMGCPVRLRKPDYHGCDRIVKKEKTWNTSLMWVHDKHDDKYGDTEPRDEQTSSIRSMARYARAVLAPVSRSIQKLWCTWNCGMRCLEKQFRKLLERHGSDLCTGSVVRPDRQRPKLCERQLQMGIDGSSSEQPSEFETHPGHDSKDFFREERNTRKYVELPDCEQLERRANGDSSRYQKQVFDILDVGPNQRFVVKDQNGQPLIVHNCENIDQGIARDLIAEAMIRTNDAGYPSILLVHDEIIADVPEGHGTKEHFKELMCQKPAWAAGLPINSDPFESQRYRK